ncbi:MAG: hypothetical protein NT007_12685 [Candidatus Kapabacteria bacterium]|nr:hypothetical protein [Candidatus Kapabacteria bacterium]
MKNDQQLIDDKKNFGYRIGFFAKTCYGSLAAFSKACDVPSTQITAYIQGLRAAHAEIQLKFYEAGLSIDWLLSGSGGMFARNKIGNELKIEFTERTKNLDSDDVDMGDVQGISEEELLRFIENSIFKTINDLISTGKLQVKLNLPNSSKK